MPGGLVDILCAVIRFEIIHDFFFEFGKTESPGTTSAASTHKLLHEMSCGVTVSHADPVMKSPVLGSYLLRLDRIASTRRCSSS